VRVLEYNDQASGVLALEAGGSGSFTQVTLHPEVLVSAESDTALAIELHERAHSLCFIAASVNFPVLVEPRVARQMAS